MIDKQIKQLLHHHDCVVIPEFGGLIARYVSARIHPVKHTLVPPSRRIAFNEKLVLNDGLLISAIAHSNGISQPEAQQLVMAFVHQAKEQLKTENRFQLQDIGIFRYNAARKLEFEFTESENMLDASFGLPEIIARPIKAEEPAVLRSLRKERHPQVPAPKQPLRKRLQRAYNVTAGLFIGGLAVSAVYLLSLQTDYNLSSLNPISLFGAGNFSSAHHSYTRYTADYVPLTADERAAKYQEALPFFAPEQEGEQAWHTFAEAHPAAETDFEETAEFDVVAESNALAGVSEDVVKEEVKDAEVKPAVTSAKPAVAAGKPAAAAETKTAENTITSATGRSYVITGGYSTMENAEYSCAQIRKKGYEPVILLPGYGSRLYRVAVADYKTEAEAHAFKRENRKIFGETIWVLKH
ncbi:HU domain-containing protein [Botryobacter ruber]|uniref:HU domain-containing protein n=1 Tax=Botryobacter ruber TaxID=2171629 RepID=UPI000E0B2B2E|nr:HU family DNA-binding protein [Botryobacter ruber]